MDKLHKRKCRYCAGTGYDTVFNFDEIEIGCCHNCGLIQNTLRNRLEVVEDYYASQPATRNSQPVSSLERQKIQRASRFRASRFMRLTGLATGNILEIGSNEGEFLAELQKKGFNVLGVEPSHEACLVSRSKGVSVINSILEKSDLQNESYDAACMFQVFEHFEEPRDMLATLYTKLKPGGYLIIETPDIYSKGAKFEKRPHCLFNKEHLTFFSPNQFIRLLDEVGFDTVATYHYDYDAFRIPFGKSFKKIFYPIFHPGFAGPLQKLLRNDMEKHYVSGNVTDIDENDEQTANQLLIRNIKKYFSLPFDLLFGAIAFRLGLGASLAWVGRKKI